MTLPRAPRALFTSLAILAVLFLLVGCGKDSLVNPKIGPTADFSATPLAGDQPLDVTFTDHSSAGTSGIRSWFWDFGDGTTSTLQNVGHLYGAAGIYNVSLRVTTDDGVDTEVKADYVTVTKAGLFPPNAAFIATPTSAGPGTPVHFTDQSSPGSGIITAWSWDFGDSGSSNASSPTHTYTATGTYTVTLSVTTSVATDTETKVGYIVIAPTKPTAAFAAGPTVGQTPLQVNFVDQSLSGGVPITSRVWTFGDGATDTIPNPVHTYNTAGSYTVTLTVTNAVGSDTAVKANLIVTTQGPVPPTAGFMASPTSGTAPLAVQFTDQSIAGSAAITSWLWDFGDGSTSTTQNPSHSYAVGRYDVKLTVTTADGTDNENKVDFIVVTPAPLAPTVDFSGTPLDGFLPLQVTFNDLSTDGGAPITSWVWSFGDGGTSTAQNPTHTYTTEGTFNVTLSATNAAGSNSLTKSAYISTSHVRVAPVAAFVGTPTSGDAPLTVNFTDQSTPGSAPITTRAWDFGDGATSAATNPSHIYTTPGTYFVSLSVTTADGADTEGKNSYITVNVAPTAPTANFTSDKTGGFVPLTVQFTDASTDGGSPITSRSWNFGDGGTSTATNPSHTYTVPGTYNVTLTATNAVGSDGETKTGYIVASIVPVGPVAAFTAAPTSGDAPLSVQFTDTSNSGTSPITARLWEFGDGATSTATNPSHVYAVGSYDVKLTVTTADGTDNENKVSFITVTPAPVAPTVDFSGTPRDGFIPLGVTFHDESLNGGAPITSWLWSFGDGATSTLQNPTHTYTTEGVFTVTLTATNSAGPGNVSKTGYITANHVPVAPVAAFTGTPTSGDAPLTVQFTDQSTAGSAPITSRAWDFGDGGTSTATNPSHTYTNPGSYFVSLSVTTADGADTENKSGYIQVDVPPTAPTANFTSDKTNGFVPLVVQFTDASSDGGSPITSRSWNFGDGGTSTATNPSHTYTVPGTYTVTLTATNAVGSDPEAKAGYIVASVVPVGPVANFTGTPTSGNAPLTVNFTDTSTPGTSPITARAWTFGDGGTSTAQNPSHTYTTPGTYTVALDVTTAVASDNVSKTDYILVSVPPTAPTANFIADQTSGFVPLAVQFTDASSSGGLPITSWRWTFGDGGTSTAQNPTHTYTVPGSYDVKLRVANSVGPDSTTKADFIVAQVVPVGPVAAFTATPTSGNAPLTVNYTDTSSPGTSPITSRLWEFGDGATSTATNPSHVYAVGSYDVKLTVTTAVGTDNENKVDFISVTPAPVAPTVEFSGTPRDGFIPLGVTFHDESTNGGATITSWLWSFGDGGTSTAQNPVHTYTTEGVFSVTLTATNSAGPGTLTKTSYITADHVPVAPVAAFSGTPTSGDAPLTVNFTDQSTAGSAPISSRAWDFGDGGTSTATNPSHIYNTPGTYFVSLSVTTADGADTDNKSNYITVDVPPTAPTANFTSDKTNGFVPLAVQFTDASTDGGSPITSRSWNFGDGGTSTATNPTHTYTVPGTYTVTLTATNAVGSDPEAKTDYITASIVPVGPVANFTGTPTSGDAPLTVNFTDTSAPGTSPITAWAWTFGDGGTSTAQNPSHAYTAAGSYTVTLDVTTAVGDDNENKADFVSVTPPPVAPVAAFSGTPTSGTAPLTVNFTDESTAGTSPITTWAWTFGDGGTSTAQNPSHGYTSAGTYTVALEVTTADGTDTATRSDYIVASVLPVAPVADFSGTPTSGDAPLSVDFTDTSIPGTSTIDTWSWDFGDGGTSTAQNPSHTYTDPGTYDVTLTVGNGVGSDGETKNGYITAIQTAPVAAFTATPTNGHAPLTVHFTDTSSPGASPITSWLWDFGDGSTSTEQNPTHTFASSRYDVKLTVTTSLGEDNENKADLIVVAPAPTAPTTDFWGGPRDGFAPLAIAFHDLSSNGGAPITGWNWRFGDGGTSTEQNPSHTYAVAGSYDVTLSATNEAGSDSTTKSGYIVVDHVPVAPVAAFSGTPTSGEAPLDVNFTDASTPGSAPIGTWLWEFGDGDTSSVQNPTHTYRTAGSYFVSLSVTTPDGADTHSQGGYVQVSAPPTPVANFTLDETSGFAPLAIQFTDNSTPGISPITSWLWEFGDGSTSTEQNPSHVYAAGRYDVKLTVTSADGQDNENKVDLIAVSPTPVAPTVDFSAAPKDGSVPLTVSFSDLSLNGGAPITSWSWNFGDGSTSTEQNPIHTYTTDGPFDVTLTVTNVAGSSSSAKPSYVIVDPGALSGTTP